MKTFEQFISEGLASYSDPISKIKTAALRNLIQKDKRIVAFSIEGDDGVFIYTNSNEWCDDSGSGTFHGSSEGAAVKNFLRNVQKADGSSN